MGWIGVGIMFWIPALWHSASVNGLYAISSWVIFWTSDSRVWTALQAFLIVITIYGSLTVWTTPSLEMPW
jgi:hypothetical protein